LVSPYSRGIWDNKSNVKFKCTKQPKVAYNYTMGLYVVESLSLQEHKTLLKSTPMLGFLGTFSVNFEIPDYWGIGKSVSRGFGTVKRRQ